MWIVTALTLLLASHVSYAGDETRVFKKIIDQEKILVNEDLEFLRNREIILVPGIIVETFVLSDTRSAFDFSLLFRSYFGTQYSYFKKNNIPVTRLRGSSKSVDEIIEQISNAVDKAQMNGRKAIFITHSLGGLALLDWMMIHENKVQNVEGIVFLQSPFYGSPMASLYFDNPYEWQMLLSPILPFFNTNENTISSLSVEERQASMNRNAEKLRTIILKIPMITAGGTSYNSRSIFRASLNIMKHGCINDTKDICHSKIIYEGPYDDSDGMVPFESSKLLGVDFVKLEGVDHGETVLSMPFRSINRQKMTEALIKMLTGKMN